MNQAPTDINLRAAEPREAVLITAHRRAMFAEMRPASTAPLDAMAAAFQLWLAPRLARGDYVGWSAVTAAGQVINPAPSRSA